MHVIQRGNNRGQCFFRDEDYATYLGYLRYFARELACGVHAYCLMSNHVHLLLTPRDGASFTSFMKSLSQSYVQYVNRTAMRTGTLWEGRFRSCLVASDHYVFACYRYIEMNPVRAGMVASPAEYRWSSYKANAHGGVGFIQPHPAYVGMAAETVDRGKAYREMFGSAVDEKVLEDIRKATRGGHPAGASRRGRGRPSRK